jgi:Fe-S cluster assembly ATPase SufC
VSNIDFLRIATNARRTAKGEKELDPLEFYAHVMPKLEALNMDPSFLNRNVNEGFSGAFLSFLCLATALAASPRCRANALPTLSCEH